MHAYPMRAEVDIKFGMILVGVVDSLTGTYCQIVKSIWVMGGDVKVIVLELSECGVFLAYSAKV